MAHGSEGKLGGINFAERTELPIGDFLALQNDVERGGAGVEKHVAYGAGKASVGVVVGMRAEVANVGEGEADLLGDLAVDGLLQRLAGVDETAGHGEPALGGIFGAADEQEAILRVKDECGDGGDGIVEIAMAAGAAVASAGRFAGVIGRAAERAMGVGVGEVLNHDVKQGVGGRAGRAEKLYVSSTLRASPANKRRKSCAKGLRYGRPLKWESRSSRVMQCASCHR